MVSGDDDQRIVPVTGGADRPLDLLPDDPESVVAADAAPLQNQLLRLRFMAYRLHSRDLDLDSTRLTLTGLAVQPRPPLPHCLS